MKKIREIGILTWYNHGNYGSALQAYAMQTVLRRMGYNAEVVAYEMQWLRNRRSLINSVKNKLKIHLAVLAEHLSLFTKYRNHFMYFYYKYIRFSTSCDETNIPKICSKYQAIITGSDQIWSPEAFDPIFMLNFCSSSDVRKIAYAPSLGLNKIPDSYKKQYKELLSDYAFLSVRENNGSKLLRELGVETEVVVDPTMLLTTEDYRQIEQPVVINNKPFMFCYFLKTNINYKEQVRKYANEKKLQIVGISFNNEDYTWMENVAYSGPCEFLWLLDHAQVVVTNSFHGTVLSMILKTPCYTYRRFASNDPICQNSRIDQLAYDFHVAQYVLDGRSYIPNDNRTESLEFEKYGTKLIEKSMFYLKQSLI